MKIEAPRSEGRDALRVPPSDLSGVAVARRVQLYARAAPSSS